MHPGKANTNAAVPLSAHYHSRGLLGLVRALGGDNDGSGTTAILASRTQFSAYVRIRLRPDPLRSRIVLTAVHLCRIGTLEATQLVSNLSSLYVPELTVGYTAACCSDHQSFWEQYFPLRRSSSALAPYVPFPCLPRSECLVLYSLIHRSRT
jgi:hypothetical protein